ncbi:MAG: preprotein translocase subunit SecE [Terriglobia bacterium]
MAEEIGIRKDPWTRLRDYVSDVRVEMRRVTWPSKQEIYGTTVMVIITTFALGIYFSICDMFFKWLVEKILHLFLHRG